MKKDKDIEEKPREVWGRIKLVYIDVCLSIVLFSQVLSYNILLRDTKHIFISIVITLFLMCYIKNVLSNYTSGHITLFSIIAILIDSLVFLWPIRQDSEVHAIIFTFFLFLFLLQSVISILKISFIGFVGQKYINQNIYASFILFAIFSWLFSRLISIQNSWSYFMAIISFLVLIFDPTTLYDLINRSGQKVKVKYRTKQYITKLRVYISGISILVVFTQILNPLGEEIYKILGYNAASQKSYGVLDKMTIPLYSIFALEIIIVFIFICASLIKFKINSSKRYEEKWTYEKFFKSIFFIKPLIDIFEGIKMDINLEKKLKMQKRKRK